MRKWIWTAFVSTITAMTLGASPAFAWWDFAKWGMTEKQVIAASKGRAAPCDGRCYRPVKPVPFRLFVPDVVAAGIHGSASLSFDDAGKLNATYIKLQEGPANFGILRDALAGIYGAPVSAQGGGFPWLLWRDPKKGSTIQLFDLPAPLIVYEPVAAGL